MVNILSLLLPTNPLSLSQYGRELHLAWKGWNDDAAFHYEMQAATLGPECWCIFQHWHFRHRPQAQKSSCPNGIPDHNWKAPNLTVGCRCRKENNENSWDGSRQTQIRPVRKLQTGTHQRRQRYPKTPEACLSSLIPIAFCAQCRKGEEVASFKQFYCDTQGHGDSGQQHPCDNSSWVLPFWLHQLQLFKDFVPQISWQRGESSQLTVDDLGMVKCFSCLHSWIAPILSSLWRTEVLRSRGFLRSAADLNQLLIAQKSSLW